MEFALSLAYDERDIIRACVRKERWAQQVLYEEFYSPLMLVCLRYARDEDEAMDLLHESFLKIFRSIGKYKPGTSLGAWMRRITVNTAIDYYRRNARRRTENLDQAYDLHSSEADAVSHYSEQEILRAIQQLSPVYRTVFNLYVIEGYSHKEIAKQLEITESTSRSNLVKARSKLQEMLTEQHEN
ncbi:MAG: sigma-70 family RNA polymerase sigma factor [Bacteroidetes bacterium]|nr:MAG: sigma-70 family RNA polymerase sigma factor [Bacteroidota bacterium]